MKSEKEKISSFGTAGGRSIEMIDQHPLYDAIRSADDKEQYSDMLHHATDLLEIYPNRPTAYLLKGKAWHRLGIPNKAEEFFRKAIQMYENHYAWDKAQVRADTLKSEFEKSKYRDKGQERKIVLAELFISFEARESAALAWCDIGELQEEDEASDKAIDSYQQALTIFPECCPALFSMGQIFIKQKKWQKAIDCFTVFTKCDPQCNQGWNDLAWAYIKALRWRPAIKSLRECINNKAENPDSWRYMGDAFCGLAKDEKICKRNGQSRFEFMHTILLTEAIYCYRKSFEGCPEDSLDAYIGWKKLSHVYCELKLYSLAERACQMVVISPPLRAGDWADLGYTQIMAGKTEAGVKNTNKALRMDPFCSSALDSLGVVELQKENYAAAEEYFKQALNIDPYLEDSIFNLALIYCKTSQWTKAFDQHKRLVKIGARNKAEELRPHLNAFSQEGKLNIPW